MTYYDKDKDELFAAMAANDARTAASNVRVVRHSIEEATANRDSLREQLKAWQALEDKWGTPEHLADEIAMWEWLIGVREKKAEG